MKIALIGFMAVGKSTVAKLLSQKLGFEYYDTDLIIQKKEKKEIAEIFSNKGEEYFRHLENEILHELLDEKKSNNIVIATGGGIVLSERNRELLKNNSITILLTASPSEIVKRIDKNNSRPLLMNNNTKLKKIEALMKERSQFYYEFKNIISTDNKTPSEVVKEIRTSYIYS